MATRANHPGRRRGDSLRGWVSEHWKTVAVSVPLAVAVVIGTGRIDDNSARIELAVCAIQSYADDQARVLEQAGSPAAPRLRQLEREMRATGIRCPTPKRP